MLLCNSYVLISFVALLFMLFRKSKQIHFYFILFLSKSSHAESQIVYSRFPSYIFSGNHYPLGCLISNSQRYIFFRTQALCAFLSLPMHGFLSSFAPHYIHLKILVEFVPSVPETR